MWWNKQKRVDPLVRTELGDFIYDGEGWAALLTDGKPYLFVYNPQFDVQLIAPATALLHGIRLVTAEALDYARAHSEFIGPADAVELESIDITELLQEKFALTFGSASHPDLTITVEFCQSAPVLVWAAD